jgi:hypothetical protein
MQPTRKPSGRSPSSFRASTLRLPNHEALCYRKLSQISIDSSNPLQVIAPLHEWPSTLADNRRAMSDLCDQIERRVNECCTGGEGNR